MQKEETQSFPDWCGFNILKFSGSYHSWNAHAMKLLRQLMIGYAPSRLSFVYLVYLCIFICYCFPISRYFSSYFSVKFFQFNWDVMFLRVTFICVFYVLNNRMPHTLLLLHFSYITTAATLLSVYPLYFSPCHVPFCPFPILSSLLPFSLVIHFLHWQTWWLVVYYFLFDSQNEHKITFSSNIFLCLLQLFSFLFYSLKAQSQSITITYHLSQTALNIIFHLLFTLFVGRKNSNTFSDSLKLLRSTVHEKNIPCWGPFRGIE